MWILQLYLNLIIPAAVIGHLREFLEYHINSQWNGQTINHAQNPAIVKFSNIQGQLNIEVSASFYNSPKLPQTLDEPCPQRSVFGLWNYELQYN